MRAGRSCGVFKLTLALLVSSVGDVVPLEVHLNLELVMLLQHQLLQAFDQLCTTARQSVNQSNSQSNNHQTTNTEDFA